MTRNYEEKLSAEIITGNYEEKLSASILCRGNCGFIGILTYPKIGS